MKLYYHNSRLVKPTMEMPEEVMLRPTDRESLPALAQWCNHLENLPTIALVDERLISVWKEGFCQEGKDYVIEKTMDGHENYFDTEYQEERLRVKYKSVAVPVTQKEEPNRWFESLSLNESQNIRWHFGNKDGELTNEQIFEAWQDNEVKKFKDFLTSDLPKIVGYEEEEPKKEEDDMRTAMEIIYKEALEEILELCCGSESSMELVGKIEKTAERGLFPVQPPPSALGERGKKERCQYELFVEKYYGLSANCPNEMVIKTNYADLVNLLAMFDQENSQPQDAKPRMFTEAQAIWLVSKFITEFAPQHSQLESPAQFVQRSISHELFPST